MLMTLVWLALQALEATQNNMVSRVQGQWQLLLFGRIIVRKVSFENAPRALQMLMTLVWMALQALEATQNNMVVQNLGLVADVIVSKDIC